MPETSLLPWSINLCLYIHLLSFTIFAIIVLTNQLQQMFLLPVLPVDIHAQPRRCVIRMVELVNRVALPTREWWKAGVYVILGAIANVAFLRVSVFSRFSHRSLRQSSACKNVIHAWQLLFFVSFYPNTKSSAWDNYREIRIPKNVYNYGK